MHCPRCKTAITEPFNPEGIIPCPGCGARLMTKAAALRSQGGRSGRQAGGAPGSELPPAAGSAQETLERHPPSATLPPGARARVGSLLREGASSEAAEAQPETGPGPVAESRAADESAGRDADEPARRTAAEPGSQSAAEPGSQSAAEPGSRTAAEPGSQNAAEPVTLESLRRDILALQAGQREILDELRRIGLGAPASGTPAEPERDGEQDEGTVLSPVRTRRRKSVLLVDDDAQTREAAVAALQQADVPVRALGDGNSALEAIAAEKPDVIAIELALEGDMPGKDVINMIKATMEWVDIPIVLWTREAIASQKEARQIHGADEIVRKTSGPEALVACAINLFRRA